MKRMKCYIYTRVSTSIQVDGYVLDAQKDKLRKYAEFQNMLVAGEYCDEGKSARTSRAVRSSCGCCRTSNPARTASPSSWCLSSPASAATPPTC